jgi:DNA-binding response OmpR family regulator
MEVCRRIRTHMVFSRRQLLDHVWGGNWYGDDHVIDVPGMDA